MMVGQVLSIQTGKEKQDPAAPLPALVELLERLCEEARIGTLRGFAFASLSEFGMYETDFEGGEGVSALSLLGALDVARSKVLKHILDNERG